MRAIFLLVMLLLVLPASAAPLVKVEIFNNTYNESLTVLEPTNDSNWIRMIGGSNIVIPSIKMVYNGINSTQYVKNNKTVKITTYGILKDQDYTVDYPFTKHPFYHAGDSVSAEILSTSDLNGSTVHIYLVRTYPTELKNALASAVDGDTQQLRNLLSNAFNYTNVTLNSTGDATVSFGVLPAGDYVVVATLNTSTESNITLISATAFEVLEHESTLSVSDVTRSSVSDNKFVSGTFTITGGSSNANYTYIAALVKKTAYSVELRLESSGNKSTTHLKANNAVLVDSFKIGGVGLKNVNATTVYNWIKNAFPSSSASLAKTRKQGNSWDFSLPVKGLPDGDYYLNIGAWNSSNSSQRLVAFSQALVKVKTVAPAPAPAAPAPAPPPPETLLEAPSEFISSLTKTISANVETEIPISSEMTERTGLLEMTVKLPETATVTVTISKVKELPAKVSAPPAEVYIFFEVKFTKYGTTEEVEPSGYIDFKVSKDWVESKGYTPAQVVLMKYNGGWKELKTELVDEDENSYYYRAEVESFSIFAVAAKPVKPTPTPTKTPVVIPTTPPAMPTATPTLTPTATPTVTPTPTATPIPPTPWYLQPTTLLIIVLLVAAFLVAAYTLRRGK